MFLSTNSVLCCPSQPICECSRVISALFLREISFSRCERKGVGKASKIRAKNMNDSRGGAVYLADLVICHPMELQGAFEVVLDLRANLTLRLPDGLLLSLIAEKPQGGPQTG